MRNRVLSVLAAAALTACQGGNTVSDAQRTAAIGEVSQTVDSLFAAMNAHDPDRLLAHYRKGNDFTYVAVATTMRGWDAFAGMTRAYVAQHPDVTFEHHILQIQVPAPDVAVATIEGSASDAPFLMWTQVYVRENGRWVITLEHESWPGAREPAPSPPSMELPGADTAR